MQFEDPRSILEAAAAKPTRGIDASALLRQGARQRRARLAAIATGVAVVVIAASASFGALTNGRRDDAAPGPAAPSPGTGCGAESKRASLYLRDDVTAGAARSLASMLDGRLRELDEASRAAYVSQREAYRELVDGSRDSERSWELQWSDVPARIDLENVDEATVAKIEKMSGAMIDTIQRRTNTTSRDGVCVEVVEGGEPPQPSAVPHMDPPQARGRRAVVVDVVRAECRTGTARLAGGSADFTDGSKWCRFVLFVNNRAGRALRLDLDDQRLRTTDGDATTPWADAMFDDFSTRLFASPIPAGAERLGQVFFLLPPDDVPAALDVHPRPGFAPVTFPLDYDCAKDIRDEPRGRCVFSPDTGSRALESTVSRVEVELYHCGVEPVELWGREWVVPDPPFDATNAPEGFTGGGRLERRSAVTALYVDDAGAIIRFEANEDWKRPICD